MRSIEANFDGLIGPTHFYGGLAVGNVASISSSNDVSNPKAAALQGLNKMKAVADLGFVQGVLPPHQRPATWVLRELGFTGNDQQVLESAQKNAPEIFAACYSASAMWTANAATVSPSADTHDGKVHITVANLNEKFHRSIEKTTTKAILDAIFTDKKHFTVHDALPAGNHFRDEGAANHTRFCRSYGEPGVELFVYGASSFKNNMPKPANFPARQALEASEAIARNHGLNPQRTVFAQQNPEVIDAGVFHNDVISVGNENVFFYHEKAFCNTTEVLADIAAAYADTNSNSGTNTNAQPGADFHFIEVTDSKVSVADAVQSYLFNSQLLSIAPGNMLLVCPTECRDNKRVRNYLDELIADGKSPIKQVQYYDLHQSMKNGGGPACLRLRVVLDSHQIAAVNHGAILTLDLHAELVAWVNKHYRDRLSADDFLDYQFVEEVKTALDELTKIMGLGNIYPFQ